MSRNRFLWIACAVLTTTGLRAGQVVSLVRNDTEPTWGVDDPPVGNFRDTHTTYDLIFDTPADWLSSGLFVQVIGGEGIIWNATDELPNEPWDQTWNGAAGVPMLPAGSGNSREFDTFVAPPDIPFMVNPGTVSPHGDPQVGPDYLNDWNGISDRMPLYWYDQTDLGPVRFVGARLTFEHPPDRPLTLDPAAPGAVAFAILQGSVAWQGNPAGIDFEYIIYQVPESAAATAWLTLAGGLLLWRRRLARPQRAR